MKKKFTTTIDSQLIKDIKIKAIKEKMDMNP